ncbi:hypothetical protein [Aeromicrobium sp. Leaf350]|uniref:hypothetical protein n=1 Tax=Aeromicrobium sp. Leaf350 TaxID=2876565 RepID=UPI001E403FC9|nr:hypothetical protein [Aeromicrobium sp. Leaf350]
MSLPPVPPPPSQVPLQLPQQSAARSRTSPGLWVALAVAVLAVVGATTVSIVAVSQDSDDSGDDVADVLRDLTELDPGYELDEFGYEYDGSEYFVEDEDVLDATEDACDELHSAASELSFYAPQSDAAAGLAGVVDAVAALLVAIDSVGNLDDDSEQWRDDVETLATMLTEAQVGFAAGEPVELDLMSDDDLAYRMSWGAPIGCEVPVRVLALDPDYPVYSVEDDYSYAS